MNKAKLVIFMVLALFVNAASAQDFGDHKSVTLTSKAWDALGSDNADHAIKYADKCIELYLKQAKEMQTSLKDFATDEAATYWALNDVGTCLFIKGQALLKKGDTKGALAAFKLLTDKVKFAQCWDSNGWFWKPSEAAKQKIVELNFDAE
jgi:hypothetical protein